MIAARDLRQHDLHDDELIRGHDMLIGNRDGAEIEGFENHP
jgi:hypothetical protein